MRQEYEKRHVIAKTVTYICLAVSGISFALKAYYLNSPFSLIWFVLAGAFVGVPASLAVYYYDGVRKENTDIENLKIETLARTGNPKRPSEREKV